MEHLAFSVNAANPGSFILPMAPFTARLEAVETYWEFSDSNPLRTVEGMEATANQFANTTNTRFSTAREGQAFSLRLQIYRGVLLRIYAKTNRRIRFEVSHNLKEANVPFRYPEAVQSPEQIRPILSSLRTHAADIVNSFLTGLNSSPSHLSQSRSAVFLLMEAVAATRNYELARLLIESLCVNGRYRLLTNDPLRGAVRLLKARGVLQNRRNSPVYTSGPQWSRAAAILAHEGRLERLFEIPAVTESRQR